MRLWNEVNLPTDERYYWVDSDVPVPTISLHCVRIIHDIGKLILVEKDLDFLGEEMLGSIHCDVDLGPCDIHLAVHPSDQTQQAQGTHNGQV